MERTAETVVLVNERDEAVGTAEKLAAHRGEGQLHRAFSVFLFDSHGRMLVQQRAVGKYHFASLWTNACCSHPRPGEGVLEAARRRIHEELGLGTEAIEPLFELIYEAEDPESGLVEREYDHVLAARCDAEPNPCESEVSAVALRSPQALLREILDSPDRFTPWFRKAMHELDVRGLLEKWGRPVPAVASAIPER
ncbi:MAG: isopentenyl-diphosphate Delta-isomerase [Myxococcota bacterium]